MRLSCNGCRVLRKGCNEACTIRTCLQWIKSPEAQANATVFLAKFYGRAGLMNLINAGPDNLRPAIFRSLLYEACGRIVNPIYGSVGLLWSGNWHMCQAAVEAVLKGAPIVQISSEAAAASPTPAHLHKAYDIRHFSKPSAADPSTAPPLAGDLHKVAKPGRTRFKRASSSSASAQPRNKHHKSDKPSKNQQAPRADLDHQDDELMTAKELHHEDDLQDQSPRATLSHASSDTHDEEPHSGPEASLDTDAEAGSHVSQAEQSTAPAGPAAQNLLEELEDEEQQQLGLELTLGFAPVVAACVARPAADAGCRLRGWSASEPGVAGFRFL
ncbi:LOB domain-containing protein 42-like [Phragmites australis]|uniref:LOB domain-containing protein 42-like n=1 Tax=Phragmites australis TaxID=29695 RepID=UPI002D771531|nr:LOB domain-containing protein 42-like [Phragmites australis]